MALRQMLGGERQRNETDEMREGWQMTDMREKLARIINPKAFEGPNWYFKGSRPAGEPDEDTRKVWARSQAPARTKALKAADAIIADLPEMVEPLEWFIGSHRSNDGDHEAQTMLGTYSCRQMRCGRWSLWKSERWLVEELFPTVEGAKATAKADYTRRILSAFGVKEGE